MAAKELFYTFVAKKINFYKKRLICQEMYMIFTKN